MEVVFGSQYGKGFSILFTRMSGDHPVSYPGGISDSFLGDKEA